MLQRVNHLWDGMPNNPFHVGWHHSCSRSSSNSNVLLDHIGPVLNRLSVLHNFTVESQVRFTAPLAFTPQQITTTEGSIHGLTGEDLTVFVNSAEWTLCMYIRVFMSGCL
jgi:hypothetical protein